MVIPLSRNVNSLGYDFSKFSFESFAAWIGQHKKCHIILRPRQFRRSTFGIWIPRDGRHYVYYDAAPPAIWSLTNGLHELGHIYLDHRPKDITEILATSRSDVVNEIQSVPGDPILGLCKSADFEDEQDEGAEKWALEIIMLLQRRKYPLVFQANANQIDILPGTGIA